MGILVEPASRLLREVRVNSAVGSVGSSDLDVV